MFLPVPRVDHFAFKVPAWAVRLLYSTMGAGASSTSRITASLAKEGVTGVPPELVEAFVKNRQTDNAALHRDNLIEHLKQLHAHDHDEKVARQLLKQSDKERNRPNEQKRLKKLFRRHRGFYDLQMLIDHLRESIGASRTDVLSAYPPIHPADGSVDSKLSGDALGRLGLGPDECAKAVKLTVEMMR